MKKNYPRAWIYKPSDFIHSGIPDLLICIDGLFIAIELKVPGLGKKSEATPIQQAELNAILNAGGRTAVCHSKNEVEQFIDEIMKGR